MVAELVATKGALQGVVLSLDKEKEWVLGRDPESCHLVVEDPKVERKALLIRQTDEGYVIESLSETPLTINEEKLMQSPLEDGDEIQIGTTLFEFHTVGAPGIGLFNVSSEDFEADSKIDLTHIPLDKEKSEEFEGEKEKPTPPSEEMEAEGKEEELPPEEKPPSEELEIEGKEEELPPEEKPPSEEMEGEKEEEPLEEKSPSEELQAEGNEEELPPEEKPPSEEMEGEKEERLKEWPEEIEEWDAEKLSENEPEKPQPPPIPAEELDAEGIEKEPTRPIEEFETEDLAEEEPEEEEPLFAPEESTPVVDLTPTIRFLLKVIAGPNTGAEFALDMGREYLIGTDANTCDIVFHDLSVSREHARLYLSEGGELQIEDLGSRNGVLIDQEQIMGKVPLMPNQIISLGTTAFFIIDREAPQETIVSPTFEAPRRAPEPEEEAPEEEEKKEELPPEEKEEELVSVTKKQGVWIYMAIVGGLILLLAIGTVSLFQTKELEPVPKNYMIEIKEATQDFPGVKYTYSPATKRLFLVGHVTTGVEKSELLYNLNALSFLKGIEDNVVNDEAVWQETNILLSKHPEFKGVSMHSPRPAVFVLSGYLKNEKQAADLTDWINIHFNYLNLLENRVVVEELVVDEVSSQLMHEGFGAVMVNFSNGELTLAGYVSSSQAYEFERLVFKFKQLPGVRSLQNFVIVVAPEEQVIDLNQRYPGRYKVTGYSKHGDVSINVVVNGRILSRGDELDNMTLTSIQPHAIFFEKDGLKYKLEYNK